MADSKDNAILFTKLARIMSEIKELKKSGWNSQGNGYAYVTEVDVLNELRPRLAKENVFVFTSVDSQEVSLSEKLGNKNNTILTMVSTSHTFACGDSGATFTVKCQGQGTDTMDKGVFKAITGAMKYFTSKTFMIGSEDDPEKDEQKSSSGNNYYNKTEKSKAPKKSSTFNSKEKISFKKKPTTTFTSPDSLDETLTDVKSESFLEATPSVEDIPF